MPSLRNMPHSPSDLDTPPTFSASAGIGPSAFAATTAASPFGAYSEQQASEKPKENGNDEMTFDFSTQVMAESSQNGATFTSPFGQASQSPFGQAAQSPFQGLTGSFSGNLADVPSKGEEQETTMLGHTQRSSPPAENNTRESSDTMMGGHDRPEDVPALYRVDVGPSYTSPSKDQEPAKRKSSGQMVDFLMEVKQHLHREHYACVSECFCCLMLF